MKIIQALKETKDLLKKAEDLRNKIKTYCAFLNFETPTYGTAAEQTAQVERWIQAHTDIVQRIAKLRVAIQKTNVMTNVTIDIDGKSVTKSIAEWIHRRRDLAKLDQACWSLLTDRGLKEGRAKNSAGEETEVKIIRCYSPAIRDAKTELYRSEPTIIDSTLETINAVTDLIE